MGLALTGAMIYPKTMGDDLNKTLKPLSSDDAAQRAFKGKMQESADNLATVCEAALDGIIAEINTKMDAVAGQVTSVTVSAGSLMTTMATVAAPAPTPDASSRAAVLLQLVAAVSELKSTVSGMNSTLTDIDALITGLGVRSAGVSAYFAPMLVPFDVLTESVAVVSALVSAIPVP